MLSQCPTPDDTQCRHVNHSCAPAAKSSRLGLSRGSDLDGNHRAKWVTSGWKSTAVGVVVNFAYYGLVFVFSLFFQAVQQLSPQQTGLAFLPMTAILMVMNIVAGRLVTRVGTRALMVAGLALASFGYLLLLRVDADRSYLTLVLPMLLAASGIALVVPTMTNATLSAVDAAHAGIASGVLNSARQIGGMLGVAVCGFFVRDTEPGIFLHGMHVSLALAVVLLSAGGILSYLGLKKHTRADMVAPHG
ncbi:MFS transporter [Variovorax gossypii]